MAPSTEEVCTDDYPFTPWNTTTIKDWRINLLGEFIRLNQHSADEEAPVIKNSTQDVLSKKKYDYIALLFTANYCPHCKKFAPHVVESANFFEQKRAKVLVITNDRDAENYEASCAKMRGVDMLTYDTSRTQKLRDLFGLKTIPALMILENDNFDQANPRVITNARNILENDPKLAGFPWDPLEAEKPVTGWDRFFIHGKHGQWWHLGHRNVSKIHPEMMYMDEHAVRIRAGLLNTISWMAMINVWFFKNQLFIKVMFPVIALEFLSSGIIGMTPVAPLATLATLIAMVLQPTPLWKPANPKRFAWAVGLTLATSCFLVFQYRNTFATDTQYRITISIFIAMCNFFTWLESSAGFCVGCFIYNRYLTKWFGLQECSDCKL